MSKQRILAIEYIRGVAMLGVVGIHTGAYSLANPFVNIHLFALLEIFTRFSVPIFFFVSAFGLFINHNFSAPFNYFHFMARRIRTVLVPYLVWSALYMAHYTFISGDIMPWTRPLIYKYLLFGLASYQLYFLIILLWFYAMMPLWRLVVKRISPNPLPYIGLLLLMQIAFNYYSSYILAPVFSNHYLNLAIEYRLSYWVVHYVFIFLFGALFAVKYNDALAWVSSHRTIITAFFALTLAGMLGYYYYLLYGVHFPPEGAVNTDHQLSPIGVLYTLASSLFLFMLFNLPLPAGLSQVLRRLGQYSYPVYLVHPLIMYYLVTFLERHNIVMSAAVTIAFYILTVTFSLSFGIFLEKLTSLVPIIGLLLTGSGIR